MQILSTWISLESLSIFKKKFSWRQCLLSPFSRYCCSKAVRYYDPLSGLQGATGWNSFYWELLTSQSFSFSNLKYFSPSQFLASSNSRGYHWILKFLVATLKIKWLGGKNVRLFPVCVSVLRYFISDRIALHFFSCTNTLLNISW